MAEEEMTDERFVRLNSGELNEEVYSETDIAVLIQEHGRDGAVASIWREKVARYSKMIDLTESGASRKMSQLHDHALHQAEYWEKRAGISGDSPGVVRVSKIERS